MKNYTDLEQSKKLAEILPLESADMFYNEEQDETYPKDIVDTKYPMVIREGQKHYLEEYGNPCWSLAALLDVIRKTIGYTIYGVCDVYISCELSKFKKIETKIYDNEVDACYEMIVKLKEENLL